MRVIGGSLSKPCQLPCTSFISDSLKLEQIMEGTTSETVDHQAPSARLIDQAAVEYALDVLLLLPSFPIVCHPNIPPQGCGLLLDRDGCVLALARPLLVEYRARVLYRSASPLLAAQLPHTSSAPPTPDTSYLTIERNHSCPFSSRLVSHHHSFLPRTSVDITKHSTAIASKTILVRLYLVHLPFIRTSGYRQ